MEAVILVGDTILLVEIGEIFELLLVFFNALGFASILMFL